MINQVNPNETAIPLAKIPSMPNLKKFCFNLAVFFLFFSFGMRIQTFGFKIKFCWLDKTCCPCEK